MSKALEILLLVVAPLAWGLGVERLFEHVRRRRNGGAEGGGDGADDGTA